MTIAVHSWLDKLLNEAMEFEETLFPPLEQAKKSEEVLGDVPMSARKCFALASYYRRECERLKLEGRYQEMTTADKQRFWEMDQKDDVLMEVVWSICYEELHDWTPHIGIRKGWKLVRTKPENPLHGIIAAIGGEPV